MQNLTATERRGLDLFAMLLSGTATEKDELEYWDRHADYVEKRMGKAIPNMTVDEFEEYKAMDENLKQGDLEGDYCPLCRKKGYVVQVEEGRTTYVTCKCMTERENKAQLLGSTYVHLITTRRLDNFEIKTLWQKAALRKIKAWGNQTIYPILYLGGKSGTGKTHLAVAIFYHFVLRGYRAKFISWRDEVRDLKFRMKEFGYYDRKLRDLKTVPLLMIDDFLWQPTNGTVTPTAEDFQLAKEIIDARINANLRTIITGNYTIGKLNELEEVLGGRIYQSSGSSENFCLTFGDGCENYRAKKAPTLLDLADEKDPF